jgi:hypothetical protein
MHILGKPCGGLFFFFSDFSLSSTFLVVFVSEFGNAVSILALDNPRAGGDKTNRHPTPTLKCALSNGTRVR